VGAVVFLSTDTRFDLILRAAARAGTIFCENPLT
jgi:DNA-directed RNA polymerase subunit K/omega